MSFDTIGNIAILKFDGEKKGEKKKIVEKLMKEHSNIQTVLEKTEKVKGKLRTIKTKYLAGKKTKEAIYRENGCIFKLNIDTCYFSPRLSNERLEIARKCKEKDRVLVLFAGVAPYPIAIAKLAKSKVVSVELGRDCYKYARENVKLNKLENVEIIQGDVKNLAKFVDGKFDKIVMPRPQLKDTFLQHVWKFCKKGTEIYYYGFGKNIAEILEQIYLESKKAKKKIEILKVKYAGNIAPFKYRFRIEFKILN